MKHNSKETLGIAWCDNGMVDGKFTSGLVYTMVAAAERGLRISRSMRVLGNQIARQRNALLASWYDNNYSEWLLWVDSDIVLTIEVLETLWKNADKNTHPVVTGTYFISMQAETPLMQPMPALFVETENKYELKNLHPLPVDQLVKVDCAGMGIVLMHRSIVAKLRKEFGDDHFMFGEEPGNGKEEFVGEDISFFRKLKAINVPVYAHTGAIVMHMKRFALDKNYYNLYWAALQHSKNREQLEQSSE